MGTLRELFEKREIIISLRNDNEGPDWSSFLTVSYIIDNQDMLNILMIYLTKTSSILKINIYQLILQHQMVI